MTMHPIAALTVFDCTGFHMYAALAGFGKSNHVMRKEAP